jgi:CubicO group peptidase (beta-lactamase class C family)
VEKKLGAPALQMLLHDTGERWTYGAGTRLLGQIIEKVSGETLDAFFASRVFAPLGMRDTAFTVGRRQAHPCGHRATRGRTAS